MAGQPFTSPWAPPEGRLQDAFRIADMIRDTGMIQAQGQYNKRLAVADLITGVSGTAIGMIEANQEKRKQEEIASILQSGEAFDAQALVKKYGMATTKRAFDFYESTRPKDRGYVLGTDQVKFNEQNQEVARGPEREPTGGITAEEKATAEELADGIFRGDAPPVMTGMYKLRPYIQAALMRKGMNLADAETDWRATQRYLASRNGTPNLRMESALYTADHSLDVIADLANKWDALDKTAWDGQYKLLNKATVLLATNGALGPEAAKLAQQLQAQINDVSSELGQIYMGGTSPTDHALKLGAENLSADWSKDTLLALIKQAKGNIRIRQNSMGLGPVGTGANPYYQRQPEATDPDAALPTTPQAPPPVVPYFPPVQAQGAGGPPPGPPPAVPSPGGGLSFTPGAPPPTGVLPGVRPQGAPAGAPPAAPPPAAPPAARITPQAQAPPGIVILVNPRTKQELHVPVAEVAQALKDGATYPDGSTSMRPSAVPPPGPTIADLVGGANTPATEPADANTPDPYKNAVVMKFKDGTLLYVLPADKAEAEAGGAVPATDREVGEAEFSGAIGEFTGKGRR